MKSRTLIRSTPSRLALVILINAMIGQAAANTEPAATIESLQRGFAEQQELLAVQAEQLERQEARIRDQTEQLQTVQAQLQQLIAMQSGGNKEQMGRTQALEPGQAEAEQPGTQILPSEVKVAQTAEEAGRLTDIEDPARIVDEELPGYIRIPNTDASMKLGGYVKMSVVNSFDQVGSEDRFVVGTIPVTGEDAVAANEASLTTRQSRLNLDVRRSTERGPLRAFIEGDFAGEGDTFRLRHAYGQFGQLLAGQTWSTFTDTEVVPEDIDFEGLNGRVIVRQPQLRYFPNIGRDVQLAIAIEDPSPDVTGGMGLTEIPDIVASIRRSRWDKLHIRSALLLRQIQAEPDDSPGVQETDTGWALSLSGYVPILAWSEHDKFMFQMNYGEGIGRYINDLASVGGQDAVFDPVTGELKAVPAFGGYVAFEHWWSNKMRSTFVLGLTDVDNFDFQPDDAYKRTTRVTANFLYSPIPRLDLGGELLWGERENKDGMTGDAVQMQIAAKYIF